MSKKNTKDVKYRNAETGQFTTKKYAEKHPKTTVKESESRPKKK